MNIGYLRWSSVAKDDSALQTQVLENLGCHRIYADGPDTKGAQLEEAVTQLRSGDTLFVVRLDRLARSIKGVVELINQLKSDSVDLVVIEDAIDTRTSEGRYLVAVMSRLMEMNKALNLERVQISQAIAKAKGRTGGRPPALSSEQVSEAKKLISSGMSVRSVAKVIGSNQATLYRLIGAKAVE